MSKIHEIYGDDCARCENCGSSDFQIVMDDDEDFHLRCSRCRHHILNYWIFNDDEPA